MNVCIEYLYRDAGNNKKWGEVVFYNEEGTGAKELEKKIKGMLIDGEFFVAERAGVPCLYFANWDYDLDHGWHQFYSLSETNDEVNDSSHRDIKEFISSMHAATRV